MTRSSTSSAVSKEICLGFIDGLSRCRDSQLVVWRHWRMSETGYAPNAVTSSPVEIILVERPTLRSSTPAVFDGDKSEVDKTTPKKRAQYRPLWFLNARPRLTFALIIIGDYPNRASRKSKVATQPRAADRVNPPSVSDGYETCQCIARSQRRQSQRR